MPTRERVQALVNDVLQGKIIPAMHEFYADDVTMQENNNAPTVGKAANIVREQGFVDYVKEWHAASGTVLAVDGDTSFIEWSMEFTGVDGKRVKSANVAWQKWKGNHIVWEKFIYDTAPATATA